MSDRPFAESYSCHASRNSFNHPLCVIAIATNVVTVAVSLRSDAVAFNVRRYPIYLSSSYVSDLSTEIIRCKIRGPAINYLQVPKAAGPFKDDNDYNNPDSWNNLR